MQIDLSKEQIKTVYKALIINLDYFHDRLSTCPIEMIEFYEQRISEVNDALQVFDDNL